MRMRDRDSNPWIINVLDAIVSIIVIGVILAFAVLVYFLDWVWGTGPANNRV